MLPNAVIQVTSLIEIAISSAIVLAYLTQALFFKYDGHARIVALRALVCFVLANLLFWPIFTFVLPLELPLAAYIRGFTGELSITSMLLLWTAYFSPKEIHIPVAMKAWIAIVALAFYPLALGVGMLDPYAWGYGSIALLLAVIATALVALLMGSNRIAIILAIAILAWAAGWHESANLWDYILDPFLGLWAIGSLIRSAWRARAARAQTGYLFRKG
jgi:alkylhydroperoxidase/carboxymuconolactone decarboxylase family protein YurZ